DAEHGGCVEIREEDQDVVLMLVALQVLDERGAPGSLLLQPLHLVLARMRGREDPFRVAIERIDVALPRVREAADGDAAAPVGAPGILVLPRHVVLRARGEDVDRMLRRQPLGDQTAVILGSAEDLRAITLNDESDLHEHKASLKACATTPRPA